MITRTDLTLFLLVQLVLIAAACVAFVLVSKRRHEQVIAQVLRAWKAIVNDNLQRGDSEGEECAEPGFALRSATPAPPSVKASKAKRVDVGEQQRLAMETARKFGYAPPVFENIGVVDPLASDDTRAVVHPLE